VECLRAALSLTISIPERSRHKHGVVISDLSQFRFADRHARPVWPCLPDPHVCKSRRSLSAWLGQVPRQHSSGGKNGSADHQGRRHLLAKDAVRW
jgi:hypothetical protein